MSAASARPQGRRVNVFQALALLVAFAVTAGVGGVLTAGLLMPAVATTNVVTETSVRLFEDVPDELEPQPLSQQSRVWASDGSLLATFFQQNRIVVPLEDISQPMIDAVVATEDRRFYEHGGVDMTGIARAAVVTVTTDETEGGSTLTQQYVKNVLVETAALNNDLEGIRAARTAEGTAGLARKLQEAKMAIALEQRMSKEEILQGYLNIAQFGASVYGVEGAARRYFSVSAKDLTYLQAATIAGITQAPNQWDPLLNPEGSQTRRNIVLTLMRQEGYITAEEYEVGRATPIGETLNPSDPGNGCATAGGAAYFCDYVTKEIMQSPEFGETREERRQLLFRGGLDIYTTIDLRMQAAADEELRRSVPQDDPSGLSTALATVEPGTGKILAMAQNRTFNPRENPAAGETSVNYNADVTHGGSRGFQVGSTYKTFVLAEWLRSGKSLNAVVEADTQAWPIDAWTADCLGQGVTFDTKPWEPGNYDGQGRGRISVAQATNNSINTAYVSMLNQLDLCNVAEMAQRVGFERADGQAPGIFPSMVLGSDVSSPLIMANAYATFASGGIHCEPVAITRVVDPTGAELDVPDANCRQVIEPQVAATVTHALTGVMTNGSGRQAQLSGRPSAGKTGTTNQNWQTWFVGYTPQQSSAVWVGTADRNDPLRDVVIAGQRYRPLYGSSVAAPTWARYMNRTHEGIEPAPFPRPERRLVEGESVSMPNVVGRSVAQATAILEEAGFGVTVRDRSSWSNVARGAVAWTDPRGGSRVPSGTTVTLVLSAGPEPRRAADPPPAQEGDDSSSRGGGGRGNGGDGNGRGNGRGGDADDD